MVAVLPNRQYQVRTDGSRRITLRNRKFLRKFTPIHGDPTDQFTRAPPAQSKPATTVPVPPPAQVQTVPPPVQTPAVQLPAQTQTVLPPVQTPVVHPQVQRQQVRQPVQRQPVSHPAHSTPVHQPGGLVIQPLSACPTSGTFNDLLEFCIPTQVPSVLSNQPTQTQGPPLPSLMHPSEPHAPQSPTATVRRSNRSTRGMTNKYDDFTTGAEYDVSHLSQYAQPAYHPAPAYLSGGNSARVAGTSTSTPTLPGQPTPYLTVSQFLHTQQLH